MTSELDAKNANGRLIYLRKCLDKVLQDRRDANRRADGLLHTIALHRRDMRALGIEEET